MYFDAVVIFVMKFSNWPWPYCEILSDNWAENFITNTTAPNSIPTYTYSAPLPQHTSSKLHFAPSTPLFPSKLWSLSLPTVMCWSRFYFTTISFFARGVDFSQWICCLFWRLLLYYIMV